MLLLSLNLKTMVINQRNKIKHIINFQIEKAKQYKA